MQKDYQKISEWYELNPDSVTGNATLTPKPVAALAKEVDVGKVTIYILLELQAPTRHGSSQAI